MMGDDGVCLSSTSQRKLQEQYQHQQCSDNDKLKDTITSITTSIVVNNAMSDDVVNGTTVGVDTTKPTKTGGGGGNYSALSNGHPTTSTVAEVPFASLAATDDINKSELKETPTKVSSVADAAVATTVAAGSSDGARKVKIATSTTAAATVDERVGDSVSSTKVLFSSSSSTSSVSTTSKRNPRDKKSRKDSNCNNNNNNGNSNSKGKGYIKGSNDDNIKESDCNQNNTLAEAKATVAKRKARGWKKKVSNSSATTTTTVATAITVPTPTSTPPITGSADVDTESVSPEHSTVTASMTTKKPPRRYKKEKTPAVPSADSDVTPDVTSSASLKRIPNGHHDGASSRGGRGRGSRSRGVEVGGSGRSCDGGYSAWRMGNNRGNNVEGSNGDRWSYDMYESTSPSRRIRRDYVPSHNNRGAILNSKGDGPNATSSTGYASEHGNGNSNAMPTHVLGRNAQAKFGGKFGEHKGNLKVAKVATTAASDVDRDASTGGHGTDTIASVTSTSMTSAKTTPDPSSWTANGTKSWGQVVADTTPKVSTPASKTARVVQAAEAADRQKMLKADDTNQQQSSQDTKKENSPKEKEKVTSEGTTTPAAASATAVTTISATGESNADTDHARAQAIIAAMKELSTQNLYQLDLNTLDSVTLQAASMLLQQQLLLQVQINHQLSYQHAMQAPMMFGQASGNTTPGTGAALVGYNPYDIMASQPMSAQAMPFIPRVDDGRLIAATAPGNYVPSPMTPVMTPTPRVEGTDFSISGNRVRYDYSGAVPQGQYNQVCPPQHQRQDIYSQSFGSEKTNLGYNSSSTTNDGNGGHSNGISAPVSPSRQGVIPGYASSASAYRTQQAHKQSRQARYSATWE